MTRQSLCPARDRNSRAEALEIEVENAWDRLQDLGRKSFRTVCLSPNTGLIVLRHPANGEYPGEIRTYGRMVSLAHFRDDCFHALEQGRSR